MRWETPDGFYTDNPPKFSSCLNACREFEKTLIPSQEESNKNWDAAWSKYDRYTERLAYQEGERGAIMADADARCRAFLFIHETD